MMYGVRRRPAKNLTLISRVLGLGLGFGIRVLVNITALYPMLPLLDHLYLPHYKSTTALLGLGPRLSSGPITSTEFTSGYFPSQPIVLLRYDIFI